MPGPRIEGIILVEPASIEPMATVTARQAGQDWIATRPFATVGEARHFALEEAERRGWLLVDMTDATAAAA